MHTITISSINTFVFNDFASRLDMNCKLEYEETGLYYFSLEGQSTTLYYLMVTESVAILAISEFASYADYKAFPYVADLLSLYLSGKNLEVDDKGTMVSVFQYFDEDWIEESIGDAVASLKATLSVKQRYYIDLTVEDNIVVTKADLERCAVGLTSSTPRIYGYVQLLLKRSMLRQASEEEQDEDMEDNEYMEVDVPQHVSIGRIKSWQLDGAETWETYSREDVDRLLDIAKTEGFDTQAEVLNDLGSIYYEGVGVPIDGDKAVYWYKKAIAAGDNIYAPTNLGDLYRKGRGTVAQSLPLAYEAYTVSQDPYALFRIGQAHEEGWISAPDMDKAMQYYEKAANIGHHRAIKRLAE